MKIEQYDIYSILENSFHFLNFKVKDVKYRAILIFLQNYPLGRE